MARKLLEIKGSSDICASLAWSIFPVREYLKRRTPKNSEEARDCRGGVQDIFTLMDQIGCAYVPKFKRDTLKLCRVKR